MVINSAIFLSGEGHGPCVRGCGVRGGGSDDYILKMY